MNRKKTDIPDSGRLKNSGFTLVELLVAMAVGSIVMTGIFYVFRAQQNSFVSNTQGVQIQQNLRAAMYMMEREIRLAGYARSPSSCATITVAQLGEINFTWDDNENGTCDGDPGPGQNAIEDLAFGMPTTVDADRDGVPDTGVAVGTIGRRMGGSTQGFDRMANNIERLAFAYAYDENQDGSVDTYTATTTIIWGYDSDNDGDLDTDIAGNAINPNVALNRIRMVRIWAVARSGQPLRNFGGTRTFMNGPPQVVYDPGTDKNASPYTTNDSFMRRQTDTIIKCRNMGLRISTS
ncbi:hypothetical protein D3OALGB2SA_1797 [Olavius algarvensis associated proteobacterium Delta 3]|nr:hypothetical protein D3OALGB2SA_1797 [Olavius algarvensis associated proteobacterium Delta 3]